MVIVSQGEPTLTSRFVVFSTLVGAAIVYRSQSGPHKRLMLLATFAILDAAVQRWPLQFIQTTTGGYYVILDAMVLAVVVYDTRSHGRLARSYAWGSMLLIGSHVVRELIGRTPAWQSFRKNVCRLIVSMTAVCALSA